MQRPHRDTTFKNVISEVKLLGRAKRHSPLEKPVEVSAVGLKVVAVLRVIVLLLLLLHQMMLMLQSLHK